MSLQLLADAVSAGARLEQACELLGLTVRTVQRWRADQGGDDMRRGPASAPHNKLNPAEERRLIKLVNLPRYRELSPRQIIPMLATRGIYIASEATLYRILKKHGLQHHRSRARPPTRRPRALTAHGPCQVFSWDITYLPSRVRGKYFYLYLVVDVWSRRIMAAVVHEYECGKLAAEMLERCLRSNSSDDKVRFLHADNGAAMRSGTLLAKLRDLGITPSFSRPHVSDGRVGGWRGGHLRRVLVCIRGFPLRARLGFAVTPFPVPRPSNRTCGSPASGSHPGPRDFALDWS